MQIQPKEIVVCDDCKAEISEDMLYKYGQVVYKPKAIGVIAKIEKDVCWDCMQNYIKQIEQQKRKLQVGTKVNLNA